MLALPIRLFVDTDDVRNLAEWLDFEVCRFFVGAFGKVDGDELVGNVVLLEDDGDALGTR